MQIGVPAESRSRKSLVAATPETVKMLVAQGRTVTVESGAWEGAHYTDDAYRKAGAQDPEMRHRPSAQNRPEGCLTE